jgi:uroporphyrinogen III methyltransferase/synthase
MVQVGCRFAKGCVFHMANVPTSNQPLAGLRIMVTRPEVPFDPLAEQLRQLGAEVILQPAIRITPPVDWQPVDDALARIDEFHWLVFSSANGVRYLLDRMRGKGKTVPPSCRLGAIGPGTADELAEFGLHADLVPDQFRAEALAEALLCNASGRRFLLARASRGREVLAEQLIAAGAQVEQIVVYSSVDVERPDVTVAAMLHANRIDWITVTSSAIARSLARLFGVDLHLAKLAAMSPITSATLRELNYIPAAEAKEYTVAGLIKAIVDAEHK